MFPETAELESLTAQYAELTERFNEFNNTVRRIQNATNTGVGSTVPLPTRAGVAVPPVTALRGDLTNNQPRLRWQEPVLAGSGTVDHYNVYIVTKPGGNRRFDLIGSARTSPALLPAMFTPPGATVVFTVQTILVNGQAAVLEEGPTCTIAAPTPEEVDIDSLGMPMVIVTGLVLTDNSPGGGSIAWSACTVHYAGTSYSVSAGNTASAFVWWDVGNTTFSSGATYTPNDTRFLITTNTGGTADVAWNKLATGGVNNAALFGDISGNKITTGTLNAGVVNVTNINASNISTGTLSANFINGGTIDGDNVNVVDLNASNITTGTLSATRIAAASLDVTKLNLVAIIVNGTFTNNSPGAGSVAWSSTTVYHAGTAYSITGSNTNNRYIYWIVGQTTFSVTNTFTPANDRFLIATNISGTHELVWNKNGSSSIVAQSINQPIYRFGPNGAFTLVDVAFSNNSPSSGSISWTSGTAVYRGVTYSISSGNTGSSNFYVYWLLSSPTALQSSATYPSVGVDDFLIAFNSGGVADPAFEIHNSSNNRVIITANFMSLHDPGGDLNASIAAASSGSAGLMRLADGTGSGSFGVGQRVILTGSDGKGQFYDDVEIGGSGGPGLLSYPDGLSAGTVDTVQGLVQVRMGGTVYYLRAWNLI